MLPFTLCSVALFLIVVASAARRRGRLFASFGTVVLGIHTLSSIAIFHALRVRYGAAQVWLAPLFGYFQAAAYLHFLSLVWARPRPVPWRVLVSIPGMFFVAGTFLGVPWAVAAGLGFRPFALWLPYALAALGVVQSLWTRQEEVDLVLDGAALDMDQQAVRPHPLGQPGDRSQRPLRIMQITDPHLGPFMSERRLRRICERVVAQDPDLVLLTGDFLTMETQSDPGPLARALAPLAALQGRCFACRGNHDLEAPRVVATALAQAGIRLLIDEEAAVSTAAGPVQIVGLDFTWRDRAAHMAAVCQKFPRRDGHLRLVLLHDPGAFRHLPHGEGDIVLSGHTHGGQLGLLSFGLKWTVVRGLSSIPDHGLWARGRDRMYVHRGTGHYGFPLRLGVPGEQSLLRVHMPLRAPPAPEQA